MDVLPRDTPATGRCVRNRPGVNQFCERLNLAGLLTIRPVHAPSGAIPWL